MSDKSVLRRVHIMLFLALGVILCAPTTVLADELDDISIQVIGLDEIPEDALERIPMPSPNFNGLADIRNNIISRQSSTNTIIPPLDGETTTTAPITDGSGGQASPQ